MLQLFLLFVVAVSAQTVPKVATYKGYEFSFYTNEASGKLTYNDAKQVCVDAGARLAEIKSVDVQDFITTQLINLGLVESWNNWNQGYWVGGVCGGMGNPGGINNWKWEDGTSIGGGNYENWFAGGGCLFSEPNSNYASSRAYIYPFEEGVYGSQTCSGTLATWGDDKMSNIRNWICMKVFLVELELNGLWFKFYNPSDPNDRLTYDDAKAKCELENGHLAYIKDDATQQMITTQLAGLNLVEDGWTSFQRGYWVGAKCVDCMGGDTYKINWKWEDGTSIGGSNYENWYDEGSGCGPEPNNNEATGRGMLYSFDAHVSCSSALGKWGDTVDGNYEKNWICMEDLCNPNPCENGGICNAATDGYHCSCQAGFIGKNCETSKDLCNPSPCENGGTCVPETGDYSCNCLGGFEGKNCSMDLCASNPCQNNGTCVPQAGNYSCLCADGMVGPNCEIDICDPSPCEKSGTCVYKPEGNFSCDCKPAYTGTLCEIANYESSENVDYLLHINHNSFSTFLRSSEDCRSNGQSDLVIIKDAETQLSIENKASKLYGQEAKEFWIGAERKYAGWFWLDGSQLTFTNWGETGNDEAGNCLKMVSQSGSSQLQWIAGQCEEQIGYICEKPENKIDPCMETECLNSGTCFSSGSHFNCQCVAGFKGVNCEIKISDPTIAILASIIGVLALVIIILVLALVYMRRKRISPKHVQSIKSKQTSEDLRNPTEGEYLEINGFGQATTAQHNVMAQQSQYLNDGISGLENETCDTTKNPPTNATSTTDNHQYEEISHKCR